MWEKEKLLVTSNFSFSHSVFKRLVLQTRKNQGLFGKGLTQQTSFKIGRSKMKNALFVGSVVSMSDSWPGGGEFDPRLRRTFFPAYFCLSPLQKHVRKVVDDFGK